MQYPELAVTRATGNNEDEEEWEKREYIKEDKRGEHVEEDKRVQYMGEGKRVLYMEEDKGARKDLYKVMWCFIFVLQYFVSECHSLSEKEDQELCKEERRYQYQVTTEDFKKCACADLSGDRVWVYVCVCGKLRALSHDQSDA